MNFPLTSYWLANERRRFDLHRHSMWLPEKEITVCSVSNTKHLQLGIPRMAGCNQFV